MKEDGLFKEGMKALNAIHFGVVERLHREIEGLRLMLLEGNVPEDVLDEELAKRINDPTVQARAKKIVEQEHAHQLDELINEARTSVEVIELLKRLREPSN